MPLSSNFAAVSLGIVLANATGALFVPGQVERDSNIRRRIILRDMGKVLENGEFRKILLTNRSFSTLPSFRLEGANNTTTCAVDATLITDHQ